MLEDGECNMRNINSVYGWCGWMYYARIISPCLLRGFVSLRAGNPLTATGPSSIWPGLPVMTARDRFVKDRKSLACMHAELFGRYHGDSVSDSQGHPRRTASEKEGGARSVGTLQ